MHRDIKPSNLQLTSDGKLKIIGEVFFQCKVGVPHLCALIVGQLSDDDARTRWGTGLRMSWPGGRGEDRFSAQQGSLGLGCPQQASAYILCQADVPAYQGLHPMGSLQQSQRGR